MTQTNALQQRVARVAEAARAASYTLARSSSTLRNRALNAMASALRDHAGHILGANCRDLDAAVERATPAAMLDRLRLTEARIEAMALALEEVAGLADPLGQTDAMWTRPNGLRVGKRRIPLGVIGFIYEARPNVTSDAAGLCLKSGNAVVLKGGSEALHSNRAVVAALREGLERVDMPPAVVGFIDEVDREAVGHLLELEEFIDVVIPRGGEGLIRFVASRAKMPVIKHYKGVCHVYLEASADLQMATDIIVNAKCQRPSVCNAAETLLVDAAAAERLLPPIITALRARGVVIHGCPRTVALCDQHGIRDGVLEAEPGDWPAEYLTLDLAVRVVDGFDQAVDHIRAHGSLHTEVIVTNAYAVAERFLEEVDSSTVIVNASTRFADGGELGLGAEIGISTTKLHAFGPMGLRELTTTKFVVYGQGQTRA